MCRCVDLNQNGYLDVKMAIERDRKVPEGSTVTVVSEGLFGDKSVAIKPCRRAEAPLGAVEPAAGAKPAPPRRPQRRRAPPICRPGAFLAANDTIPTGRVGADDG